MIKSNELRLGNLIYYKGKVIEVRVNDIGLLHEYERVNRTNESFTPIILTPEILEKAGFTECAKVGDEIYYRIENIGVTYYDGACDFCLIDGEGWNNIKDFYFLHQLQNLYFALTGEELKIKL